MINIGNLYPLTMRLSDVRRRNPKLIYFNHSILQPPSEAASRCSNRLLGVPAETFDRTIVRRHRAPAQLVILKAKKHTHQILV